MKRLVLALAGLGLMALAAGCCCHHRQNQCNPCGPVYGASYPTSAPVAYAAPVMAAAPGGCPTCAPSY